MAVNSNDSFPDRGPSVLVVTTATLAIATVFVFARLVSRVGIVKHVTWDDYFIMIGWLIAFGLCFSIVFGTSKGLGRFDANIPDEWRASLRRCEYGFSVLYNPALMATKTSILIFYLRLARNTKPLLRIASYITLAVVNIAGIVLTFLNVFQCKPVAAVFGNMGDNATCIPLVTLYLASAPVNIITDLAILCLPIPVLTGMTLPQKEKTILVMTFALGIFVAVVDVVRIYYLQQASLDVATGSLPQETTGIGASADFSWFASLSLMWSAVEVNVGIICACVPTLKPLVSRLLPTLIGHIHTPHSSQEKSGNSKTDQTPSDRTHETSHSPGSVSATNAAAPPDLERIPSPLDASPSPHRDPSQQTWTHQTNEQLRLEPLPPTSGEDQEAEMGMMNFLTTPGMVSGTVANLRTMESQTTDNTVYFGFVNMKRPRSMLKTRGRESWKYGIIVTILFVLWGFSYGLLNTLNGQIGKISNSTVSQGLGLQSAYFGAYFFGPLTVGRWVLMKSGFKVTFITGLLIYGTGTLMFWPSAVLTSYAGFVVSNFVVGFGLSVLETAANPFLALCGHPDYAEMRLLLAQAVQAVGTVVSPLLAQKVLFRDVMDQPSLIDVQWTYLAIAFFDVMLALFFYYMPLPEATDDDLQAQTQQQFNLNSFTTITSNNDYSKMYIGRYRVIFVTLALGVSSQFLYVASQESISVFFEPLLESLTTPVGSDHVANSTSSPSLSPFNNTAIGHAAFALGRFIPALLCLIIRPRVVLLIFYTLTLLFSILVFTISNASGNVAASLGIVLYFFEGPIWPIIFAITLRGMGKHTKSASAYLTVSASGGAAFTWIMYAIEAAGGKSVQFSFSVVIALLGLGLVYPVYLNFFPPARRVADPREKEDWEGNNASGRNCGEGGEQSPIRRLSHRFSIILERVRGQG
jgi:fucose permease